MRMLNPSEQRNIPHAVTGQIGGKGEGLRVYLGTRLRFARLDQVVNSPIQGTAR